MRLQPNIEDLMCAGMSSGPEKVAGLESILWQTSYEQFLLFAFLFYHLSNICHSFLEFHPWQVKCFHQNPCSLTLKNKKFKALYWLIRLMRFGKKFTTQSLQYLLLRKKIPSKMGMECLDCLPNTSRKRGLIQEV